jgi:maleate isomerase
MEETLQTAKPADMTRISLKPEEFSGKTRNGIGIVAPFDFALDEEYSRWLPEGTPIFFTRTPSIQNTAVTVDLAQEVSSEVAVDPAVSSLLAVKPAAIGYACTSGSFVGGVQGERHLQEILIKSGAPAAVTTSGALLEALKALSVKRLAIATPYNEPLTKLLADFLEEAGFEVVSSGYLDLEHDIAKVSTDAVRRMAKIVDRPDAEAIFFSCTNLHTFEAIEVLEAELGKPILSANQITVWASLRAGGLDMPECNQRIFKA